MQDQRIETQGEGFIAPTFLIPTDAPHGWEAAVFDHFQAMCAAMANKVQLRHDNAPNARLVGGSTLHFELDATHPELQNVLSLLDQVRVLTDAVWDSVYRHNEKHPIDEAKRFNLTLYFGQNVDDFDKLKTGEH